MTGENIQYKTNDQQLDAVVFYEKLGYEKSMQSFIKKKSRKT